MTRRRKLDYTPPETVTVAVSRNGAEMSASVRWQDAPKALADMLLAFRELTKAFPELTQELGAVTSSMQVEYKDDLDWSDRKRRPMGFR